MAMPFSRPNRRFRRLRRTLRVLARIVRWIIVALFGLLLDLVWALIFPGEERTDHADYRADTSRRSS